MKTTTKNNKTGLTLERQAGNNKTINRRNNTMFAEQVQLEALCTDLIHLKAEENKFAELRKEREEQIASLVATTDEGTDKVEAGIFKITVTSKLTRTLDYEAYKAIEEGLPVGVRCVDLKPAINLKKLRALEMVDPDLPAHFISVKPAKAAVKVEVLN